MNHDLNPEDFAGLERQHAERVRWQQLAPRVRPDGDQRSARRTHGRVEPQHSDAPQWANLLLVIVWGCLIAALLVGWWSEP